VRAVFPRQSIPDIDGQRSVQPRSNIARFSENKDLSPEVVARLARMDGAHLVFVVFLVQPGSLVDDVMPYRMAWRICLSSAWQF
jgi:hypothetical protein